MEGWRDRHVGRAVAAVTAATALILLTACGDSEGGGSTSDSDAAATADTVCTLLRHWNNDFGDVLNATSDTITADDDPATANGVLADAFDQLIAIGQDHRATLDELDLPDVPDRDRLLDDLRAGADQSIASLQHERDEVADMPPIEVDDQAGALGGAFIAVERATSVIEPEIAAYDETLQEAFLSDDGCQHVIQPVG